MLVVERTWPPQLLLNTLKAPTIYLNRLIVRTGLQTTRMSKFLELNSRHALYA